MFSSALLIVKNSLTMLDMNDLWRDYRKYKNNKKTAINKYFWHIEEVRQYLC